MILGLNHVALFVKDLEASVKFYHEIIGLKKISRPVFNFPGAWFEISANQQLHLIGGKIAEESQLSRPRGNHFALMISSYKEFEQMLEFKKVEFLPPKKRPDGAMQIFLKDPDGYYVELVELP